MRIHTPSRRSKAIRKITLGSFRRRFLPSEKVMMEESTDTLVRVLDKDLMSSTFVDLDFQQTVDGLAHLVSLGILTEERVEDILVDGTPEEAYKGL